MNRLALSAACAAFAFLPSAVLADDVSNYVPIAATKHAIAAKGVASVSAVIPAAVDVKLLNTWTTGLTQGAYIHARVSLVSPRDLNISASDFVARVATANGLTQTIGAMTQAVPSVKGGIAAVTGTLGLSALPSLPGMKSSNKPLIDPHEDLGAMHDVAMKADVPVTVVITFAVEHVPQGEITVAYASH